MKKGVKQLRDYQSRKHAGSKSAPPSHTPIPHSSQRPASHFFARFLLFFVTFLFIFIILFIFFRTLAQEETVSSTTPYQTIASLSCVPQDTLNRICGTFRWSGNSGEYTTVTYGDYEDLEHRTAYLFESCVTVPTQPQESYYETHFNRYSPEGILLGTQNQFVKCPSHEVSPVVLPPIKKPSSQSDTSTVHKKSWFQAKRNFGKSDATGSYTLDFFSKVQSCTIDDGAFTITDDALLKTYVGYCNGAKGSFVSTADASTQSVIVDPSLFSWTGQTSVDPAPQTHSGYFAYAQICDHTYLTKERNYAHATLSGFGTNKLHIDWLYHDETGSRVAEFTFTLNCLITS